MGKIQSAFTIVHCPVCSVFIYLKATDQGLVEHLRLEHPQADLKPLIYSLESKLGVAAKNTSEGMDVSSLRLYLESLCRQEASAQGAEKLNRNLQKFKKNRLERKSI